ncbi:MAG: glycosyltransferase family 39 protein [Pirellulales bacterium]|nr:glycosyltransferase family 39 protein [Pirellulales bacterium]
MSQADSLAIQGTQTARVVDDSLPFGVVPAESEPLSAMRLAQFTRWLILLGVVARLTRYLLRFPLWDDECFLAANLLDQGYLELLNPLQHHQVCPVLFLWVQATIVRLLGFSEYALRLFPLVCSIAGLFLFWHLAARLLRGVALLFAVGIFAVGYPLIRYACEAKPYGCDTFVSLVLLALVVQWYQSRKQAWLWGLIVSVPLALGLSYPAVFVGGGISLAVGFVLWTDGDRRGWLAWICYNLVLLASFGGVYWMSVGPQSAAELVWMRDYWKDIFPPLSSVVGMVKWFAAVHTGELLQYPVGGARGASTLTTICCVAAVVVLWRRRQRWLIVLCLAPLLPNLVAAGLWRYPYGGSVRFTLYMAPGLCLLAGLGAAALLVRHNKQGVTQGRPAVLIVVGLLAIVAIGSMVRDFAKPYRTPQVLQQRDFARWFWFTKEYDGEVACWETELPEGADSPTNDCTAAAIYLCNRRIYSSGHGPGHSVDWSRVSAERPLRVVRYGASTMENDDEAFGQWLFKIQSRYDLVDRQRHTVPVQRNGRELVFYHYVDLYEFVPKGSQPEGVWSGWPSKVQEKPNALSHASSSDERPAKSPAVGAFRTVAFPRVR